MNARQLIHRYAEALAVDPSPKRVRCLLGNLFGIAVPSDAVRIQEIAPFVLPLASQPSATVVAWIELTRAPLMIRRMDGELRNANG